MLEALKNFEQVAVHFTPQVLVIPGLVCLAVGLYLWLGGLRWSRFVVGFFGALVGLVCALLFTDHQIVPMVAISALAAGFAVFFEEIALKLTAAMVMSMVAMLIFAGASSEPVRGGQGSRHELFFSSRMTVLNVDESWAIIKSNLTFFGEEIIKAIRNVSTIGFVMAVVVGLLAGGLALFVPRVITAMTFAILGTGLIFAGMVLLLLYKGSRPMSHIYSKALLYCILAAVMVVFGSFIDLVLCPAKKKKSSEEDKIQGVERWNV